jgi:hypothetical protein
VATTSVSLIREHTEAIKPPRALWVPFELGRPFGTPGAREFQLDVIRATLALLAEPAGPVLRDYPREAPATSPEEDVPWACALPLGSPDAGGDALLARMLREVSLLQPWHDESRKAKGRTSVGSSGFGPDDAGEMAGILAAVARGEVAGAPDVARVPMPGLLRFVADDLKAFYFEAAAAQPAARRPSARELNLWLFGETALGDALYAARDWLGGQEDAGLRLASRFMVPGAYARQPGRS